MKSKMFSFLKNKIKAFVLKKSAANKMIDIVEVRTKDIGLTHVTTETDIRIVNSFLLPITILSIKTDLLNRDGMKIGNMIYEQPQKIKRKSDEVLTTISQISIITSLFQALSTLLMQDINMRSVGIAQVKILWWIVDIPIDDSFIIHPQKIKIIKELTEEEIKAREEERIIRAHDNEINSVLKQQDKEVRDFKIALKIAERKEVILKRRHKENYLPKAERLRQAESDIRQAQSVKSPIVSNNEIQIDAESVEITLSEKAILEMTSENEAPPIDDISITDNLKEKSKNNSITDSNSI